MALLAKMMDDGLPGRLTKAKSLEEAYRQMLAFPSLGPFLAFQYVIDLNYSTLMDFSESEYVVAGPGALDGISKCFSATGGLAPEEVIYLMVDRQEREFSRLGLTFPGLFGRRLQPIDCQNLFCEISKYARVVHPDVVGVSKRTRIKQSYRSGRTEYQIPKFPPRWRLLVPDVLSCTDRAQHQLL
jgi:hypothetical protein